MKDLDQNIFPDTLLDMIPEALFILIPQHDAERLLTDLKINKVNRFGKKLLQIDSINSNHSFRNLVGASIWSKLSAEFIRTIETGETTKSSFTLGKKNTKRWFDYKAIYSQGHLMLSVQEVTEKKQQEKALKASGARYKKLFEESMDSIFIMNNEYLILEMNKAMIEFTGFHKREVHSLSLESLFADHDDFVHLNKLLYKNSHVEEYEAKLVLSNGQTTSCLINLIELNKSQKEVALFQGVIKDISKRRAAEKEMIVAEKLSMTGKLARRIAHEVRNPLTNLNLALEQLKDEIISTEEDETDFYLEIIARNANRIEELISALLNSARPRALNFKKENVNEVIRQSIELVKDRILLKDLNLQTSLKENLPLIGIDSDQLQIAIVNLMINAIEALDEQGTLEIETFEKENAVFISIADNGCGISLADQKQLFDPFFSAKEKGTGLGLTSVQNIIKSHNGNITLDSKPGEGTTFRLSFAY